MQSQMQSQKTAFCLRQRAAARGILSSGEVRADTVMLAQS